MRLSTTWPWPSLDCLTDLLNSLSVTFGFHLYYFHRQQTNKGLSFRKGGPRSSSEALYKPHTHFNNECSTTFTYNNTSSCLVQSNRVLTYLEASYTIILPLQWVFSGQADLVIIRVFRVLLLGDTSINQSFALFIEWSINHSIRCRPGNRQRSL